MKICALQTCNNEATTRYCSHACRSKDYRRKKKSQALDELCYLDECNEPGIENIIINHPDLNKLQLTLRVLLCKDHRYLLREVA